MQTTAARLLALVAAALLAVALWRYPFWPVPAALAAAAYLLVLKRWPDSWLLLVPAALPWLDLAPWTGRFYLEELDLMLLATVAAGYWRLPARPPTLRLAPGAAWLLAFWLASTAQAAVHGVLPLPALDADAFASYSSGYNSLRLAKGALWALLLLPLLRRVAGPDPDAAGATSGVARRLVPGMLTGLLMTCLAVIWERWHFPGLINFSSDYRPTAPFSAMHTGGAALDAYLAMALPFAAWWLTGRSTSRQWVVALLLLMLGLFTGFTTFSRDVWLAYAGAATVIVGCHLGPRLTGGTVRAGRTLAILVMLALSALLLARVFDTGGYRTLAAALVLAGATLALGAAPAPHRHQGALPWGFGTAVLLVLADVLLYQVLRSDQLAGWSKGPYLALALCATVCAGGLLAARFNRGTGFTAGLAMARGAWAPLALAVLLVALHWGGTAALPAAAVLAAATAMVLVLALRGATAQWRLSRATVSLSVVSGAWLALAIPILASAYMGERLATVGQDVGLRARHWREAVLIMPVDAATQWFGAGLGRYPALYYRSNLNGDLPGSFSYRATADAPDGGRYLRLIAPHHARGYGEVLRHLQHVTLAPGTRYRLSFEMRRHDEASRLALALCERWLLYPQNCLAPALPLVPADGRWHPVAVQLDSGMLGATDGARMLATPVQLSVAMDSDAGAIDIDNISLLPLAGGSQVVRNGSFDAGQDGWFFSSDRDHLPWHIKNLYLHAYVEQGWTGIGALLLLLGYVAMRLARRAWQGRPGAAVLLAALTGLLLVGCFDSVIDVPRLTLLALLLVMSACLQPVQQAHQG